MKLLKKICCSLLLAVSFSGAMAQESKETKQSPEEKAWMAYMTPGKMHEMLGKSQGLWSEEVTMWMAPEAPPMKSTITGMNKMIMGGRYLQGMSRGSFNNMPFEGISVVGYDNAKNIFVSSWIDNMGTGMMYMEGKWNDATKTIEYKGSQPDPMTGKETAVRELYKIVDENNQFLEMFMTPAGGKEYKSMEIKFTRKVTPPPASAPPKPAPAPGTSKDNK